MEILILPTAQDVAKAAASLIAERLRKEPQLVLGCATGRTMERIYKTLVQMYGQDGLDFSAC
jgi:glucosamine-6-phosphate deaminase